MDSSGTCGKQSVGTQGAVCSPNPTLGQICAAGLTCYQDSMQIYRCQAAVAQGGACLTSQACKGTLSCARTNVTDPTGVCQPLGKPGANCSTDSGLGQECQTTLQCYAADAMGQQVCFPLPDVGQDCGASLPCLLGLCTSSVCTSLLGAGLACTQSSQCQSNTCDPNLMTCQSPVCP
jgi:hypothetical protein